MGVPQREKSRGDEQPGASRESSPAPLCSYRKVHSARKTPQSQRNKETSLLLTSLLSVTSNRKRATDHAQSLLNECKENAVPQNFCDQAQGSSHSLTISSMFTYFFCTSVSSLSKEGEPQLPSMELKVIRESGLNINRKQRPNESRSFLSHQGPKLHSGTPQESVDDRPVEGASRLGLPGAVPVSATPPARANLNGHPTARAGG